MADLPAAAIPGSPDPESVRAFALDLAELRSTAGSPTLKQLAQLTGISKSVLSDAFAGRRLPTENTVRGLVAALNGDVTGWVARRLALDPRRSASTPVRVEAETSARGGRPDPTSPSGWTRPMTLGAFLAGSAVTVIIAGLVAGLIAATVAARAIPVATETPTSTTSYVEFADGVDPMLTVCREDVVLAGGDEFLDGDVIVEMMYSNHCMAAWGRVTRYDGKGSGNSMTMRIYPRDDPESARVQVRADSDLQSIYTPLLIEPDVAARVCGVATVTVDDETFVQPNPVCI